MHSSVNQKTIPTFNETSRNSDPATFLGYKNIRNCLCFGFHLMTKRIIKILESLKLFFIKRIQI